MSAFLDDEERAAWVQFAAAASAVHLPCWLNESADTPVRAATVATWADALLMEYRRRTEDGDA